MLSMRFALIVVILFIAGCLQSGPRCSPPYMEYGMGYCCLDANQNNVCDKYEKASAGNTSSQPAGGATSAKSSVTSTLP